MFKEGIGYNAEWAKKVSKSEFVKQMNEAHPGKDHSAVYDEIVPPKKVKEKPAEEK